MGDSHGGEGLDLIRGVVIEGDLGQVVLDRQEVRHLAHARQSKGRVSVNFKGRRCNVFGGGG